MYNFISIILLIVLKYSPLPTPLSSEFTEMMKECDLLRYTEIITQTKYDIDSILQSMCATITGMKETAAKEAGKKNLSADYTGMSDKELLERVYILNIVFLIVENMY